MPSWSKDVYISAADPTGRFQLAFAYDAENRPHLLRWEHGENPAELPIRSPRFVAYDINASGEIPAVDYDVETGRYSAWRFRDGEFVELPTSGSYSRLTWASINASGQIAGVLEDPAQPPGSRSLPVLWSADDHLTQLTLPAEDVTAVSVQGIDDDGTVLGTVVWSQYARASAILWYPDGTWRLLPGLQPKTVTFGASIRSGRVVGHLRADKPGAAPPPVLWTAATGEPTPFPVDVTGTPLGINAKGSVLLAYVPTLGQAALVLGGTNETRTLPVDDIPITGGPSDVTDDDIVYGNNRREIVPGELTVRVARWDCGS